MRFPNFVLSKSDGELIILKSNLFSGDLEVIILGEWDIIGLKLKQWFGGETD